MIGQAYEQLTLFPEDFHASRSAAPGSAGARMMTVISGRRCSELFRNSGPLGLLAKMLLESSEWHSTRCFLTWKARATKQGRLYFRLVPSTPRTGGTAAPLLPTPTSSWGLKGLGFNPKTKKRYSQQTKNFALQVLGKYVVPESVELIMGFPLGWTDLSASETP